MSYDFRFSASVKIATAFPTALNASAEPGARFLSTERKMLRNYLSRTFDDRKLYIVKNNELQENSYLDAKPMPISCRIF